jgi:hypothetical protein
LASPTFYPLHDIPNDFWRFTPFALEKILRVFSSVNVRICGISRFPTGYFAVAKK